MKQKKNRPSAASRQDTEFGYDLTPDIVDGVNTMSHPGRSSAVTQQTHKTPRNNTRPGHATNDDLTQP